MVHGTNLWHTGLRGILLKGPGFNYLIHTFSHKQKYILIRVYIKH